MSSHTSWGATADRSAVEVRADEAFSRVPGGPREAAQS